MSVNKIQNVLSSLEAINNLRLRPEEQQPQYRAFVTQPHNGDICGFLLDLSGIPVENMANVLHLLDGFHDAPISLCQSLRLAVVLQQMSAYGASNSKLCSTLLGWLNKGIDGSVTASISKENVDAVAEYATKCVPVDDLEVSNAACVLLEKLMKHYPNELVSIYNEAQKYRSNSSIYLRFITIFCRIAAFNDAACRAVEGSGALNEVVRLCKANDILLQINALELLLDVANTPAGLDYLCTHGVVQWLVDTSFGTATAPVDPILSGETLRVLGAVFAKASTGSFDFVGRVDPATVHRFLATLLAYFEGREENEKIRGLAIIAEFAAVSHTTLTMVCTHANGRLVSEWLDVLNAAKPELISGVLHSLARVLHQEDDHYIRNNTPTMSVFRDPPAATADAKNAPVGGSEEERALLLSVVDLKKSLMSSVTQAKGLHFVAYLLRVARLPIPLLRHAALDLLAALAAQPTGWGLLAFTQAPTPVDGGSDFVAYITNRESEATKEGKDWKFSVIKAISLNPARQHLGDEFNAKIDHMVSQGPYYMPHKMEGPQVI